MNIQTAVPDVFAAFGQATADTWVAVGSLAEAVGDADRAAAAYDNTLRHRPHDPRALTGLANLYRSRDMFGKAAELYQRALTTRPEQGDTWGLLGHCYLMLDDLERAYAAYQQALYHLSNPNVPKLWHGIGILYDRYGSLEYAEEAFTRVLELDPKFEKNNEIYFRLGIIYKHQGKLTQALECFRYVLSSPPSPLTQPDVWFQIGAVLELQKDFTAARDAYEKVLEANPSHAKVLQQYGCLYAQRDAPFFNPEKALKLLSQSLELDPADGHTWYHLGRVHMSRADYSAAYEAFQQAVNRDARNPTFWCSIGVLYYQISQYRDALDAYTRAIRLNPYISEVWYDLGTLYETCNNQVSDALDAYRQAARLDPGNPHIQERLAQLMKDGSDNAPKPQLSVPELQAAGMDSFAPRVGVDGAKRVLETGGNSEPPVKQPRVEPHEPEKPDATKPNAEEAVPQPQEDEAVPVKGQEKVEKSDSPPKTSETGHETGQEVGAEPAKEKLPENSSEKHLESSTEKHLQPKKETQTVEESKPDSPAAETGSKGGDPAEAPLRNIEEDENYDD